MVVTPLMWTDLLVVQLRAGPRGDTGAWDLRDSAGRKALGVRSDLRCYGWTTMTMLPFFCSVSAYRWASAICSKGYWRSMTGRSSPASMRFDRTDNSSRSVDSVDCVTGYRSRHQPLACAEHARPKRRERRRRRYGRFGFVRSVTPDASADTMPAVASQRIEGLVIVRAGLRIAEATSR